MFTSDTHSSQFIILGPAPVKNISSAMRTTTDNQRTIHITQDGTKDVKIAYHVPRRNDEKQITNDKKPYILRFLEKQWDVRNQAEKESRVDSPKMKKKKKADVMKKRASSDAPSTSSDPKTRRLN
ncbi:hypothetical protein V3C99_003319 [Haemonchus contortus]